MKKKTIIAIATALSIIIFGFSYSFAANNIGEQAVEGIRNVVGGAENVMQDATSGVVNGVKDTTHAVENTTSKAMNSATRSISGAMTSDNNNGNYTATRTSATSDNYTLFGMNSTTWAWLIMAILGIAIVAVVWYYGKQNEVISKHSRNDY